MTAGVFLYEQRYEIADPTGLESSVLSADEGVHNLVRNAGKLVNQPLLDTP